MVKEVVSQTEINDANLKEVKMNLLPVEYYNYSSSAKFRMVAMCHMIH